MVAIWITVGLVISAISVSSLGAAFSIFGLAKLFSGAAVAVILMSGSLEFAKFVIAAFLHQTWHRLNFLYRYYLLTAVIVLSIITSIGIFGFLSNAYQVSSTTIEAEQIKIDSLKSEQVRNTNEVARLYKGIDEIPATRISKRIKARAEIEPEVKKLQTRTEQISSELTQLNLKMLDVKEKIGPLIYIARAFNLEIDSVVKYLILIFVGVFDPLAICLVIASSDALRSRKLYAATAPKAQPNVAQTPTSSVVATTEAPAPAASEPAPYPADHNDHSDFSTKEELESIKMSFSKEGSPQGSSGDKVG